MMVTFVSQCEKNALKRTRRVLDAFADRIGDNTWQTLITRDGLQTVKKMLGKSASRHTAVSCHWIRSRSRSQLLWIVGRKNKFNAQGIVPVNRTDKSFLGCEQDDNHKYLPLINSLAGLAALLHDWGKASACFQDKLNPHIRTPAGDPLRHEWVSALLFTALVKSGGVEGDEHWLERLQASQWNEQQLQAFAAENKLADKPFQDLPDAAALLCWLIFTHHRLPSLSDKDTRDGKAYQVCNSLPVMLAAINRTWGYENNRDDTFSRRLPLCFEFPHGLLSDSPVWRTALNSAATQLKQQLPLLREAMANGCWRLIATQARLCLILGDHYYSSQDNDPDWRSDIALWANTDHNSGRMRQKLDEHLIKVAETARHIAEYLPFIESEPPAARDVDKLNAVSDAGSFGWQDSAVRDIHRYRDGNDAVSGFFVVNMAGTGCGKTRANAKIMRALSPERDSLRYILALGLRTLTLQTGDEYRDRIGLKEEEGELAVLIGSKAVMKLHQDAQAAQDNAEPQPAETDTEYTLSGSESAECLSDEESESLIWPEDCWQGTLPEEEFSTVLKQQKDRALLYAPVLACTLDHMMGATESTRGGRHILPFMRLMSSDLVIDEVDDFTGHDTVAIARLINLAGMLGRKVMISSATIPPDMALGYFEAYQQGWHIHAQSHNASPQIGCLWVHEGLYDAEKKSCGVCTATATVTAGGPATDHAEAVAYRQHHALFTAKRAAVLRQKPAKQKAEMIRPERSRGGDHERDFFDAVFRAIPPLHQKHHFHDTRTDINVSFGLVRVANIQPCVKLVKYLLTAEWPEETDVRVMAYHSQQVFLLRHEQERHLDSVLKRKEAPGDAPDALNNTVIRQHLDDVAATGSVRNLLFILVATPVEEVGRDHDFDWGIIEPSSCRSIIQASGRVRRHRDGEIQQPNVALLQYNLKGLKGEEEPIFARPGYETRTYRFATHDLAELVDEKQLRLAVNAIPRIQHPEEGAGHYSRNFAALEHRVIAATLGCRYLVSGTAIPDADTAAPEKTASGGRGRERIPKVTAETAAGNLWGYTRGCWWMTALPQQLSPFRQSEGTDIRVSLCISVTGEKRFCGYDKENGWINSEDLYGITRVYPADACRGRLWLVLDYETTLREHGADNDGLTPLSRLYGELTFTLHKSIDNTRWCYDEQLGLYREE